MPRSFEDKKAEFTGQDAFLNKIKNASSSVESAILISEHSDTHRYVAGDARAYRMLQALADKNGLVMPNVEEIYGTELQFLLTPD